MEHQRKDVIRPQFFVKNYDKFMCITVPPGGHSVYYQINETESFAQDL